MIGVYGIIIWFASFMGLCFLSKRLFRIDAAFAPMITASIVIAVLMLSGMTGFLNESVMIVYALGFTGIIGALKSKRQTKVGTMFVLFACAGYLLFLIGKLHAQTLTKSDDFGHWGLVARYINANNTLPNAAMELMQFPSYPVGSASFIYYVCRFSENSDRMYLIAQAMLVFIYSLPLLSLIKKTRIAGRISFLCIFLILSSACVFIVSLQVDTLIAFMGYGAMAVIVSQRNHPAKALGLCAPVLAAMGFVKISGLFFVVMCATTLLYFGWAKNRKAAVGAFCAAIMIGVCAFFVWQTYASVHFPEVEESVHVINASAYVKRAEERGGMLIPVLKAYAGRIIHSTVLETCLFLYSFLIPVVFIIVSVKRKSESGKKQAKALLCFLTVAYGTYNLFMICMYFFSMTVWEAESLASFARYYRSMLVYLALISSAECIRQIYGDQSIFVRQKLVGYAVAGALVVSLFAGAVTDSRVDMFFRPLKPYPLYERMQTLTQGMEQTENSRHVVFVSAHKDLPEFSERQLNRMLVYELNTIDVICIVKDERDMQDEYRVYNRRYETEKAGGVIYMLNDIPYETMTEKELLHILGQYVRPGDNIFMLEEDTAFAKMVDSLKIDDLRIVR